MSEEIKKKRLIFLPNGKGYTEEEDSMYKKNQQKKTAYIFPKVSPYQKVERSTMLIRLNLSLRFIYISKYKYTYFVIGKVFFGQRRN